MKSNVLIVFALSVFIISSCGNKTKLENKDQPKDTTVTKDVIVNEEDEFAKYDSINKLAIEKNEVLTLLSGSSGPDGAYIYFKTEKGDSLFAAQIPDFIKWKEVDEGIGEIEPKFLNKKYSVKYKIQTEYYEPGGIWEERMIISEMKAK